MLNQPLPTATTRVTHDLAPLGTLCLAPLHTSQVWEGAGWGGLAWNTDTTAELIQRSARDTTLTDWYHYNAGLHKVICCGILLAAWWIIALALGWMPLQVSPVPQASGQAQRAGLVTFKHAILLLLAAQNTVSVVLLRILSAPSAEPVYAGAHLLAQEVLKFAVSFYLLQRHSVGAHGAFMTILGGFRDRSLILYLSGMIHSTPWIVAQ